MSYVQTIIRFRELLQTRSELFNNPNLQNLQDSIVQLNDDQIQEAVDAIMNWTSQYSKAIFRTLRDGSELAGVPKNAVTPNTSQDLTNEWRTLDEKLASLLKNNQNKGNKNTSNTPEKES